MSDFSRLREKAGLNQSQLAELVGVSRAAICRYEKGLRAPEIDIAQKISKELGLSLRKLRPDLFPSKGAAA